MINFVGKGNYNLYDLVELVRFLRSENGCPWDREQTHESIRRNFIEEAYEAVEAINEKDSEHLKEELGDVLLQVIFHTLIEEENGAFSIDDVADGVGKKLVERHPHVFGTVVANDAEQVLDKWEEIKRSQRGQTAASSAMRGVSRALPGTWRADKVQSKAEKEGFVWSNTQQAVDKLREEVEELQKAVDENGNIEEELGDVLFAAVSVARLTNTDPEEALYNTVDKFIDRFAEMEQLSEGRLNDKSKQELISLWNSTKTLHNKTK